MTSPDPVNTATPTRFVPCVCVDQGLRHTSSMNTDDPDGSPDECPHCDHTGEIPDFIRAALEETP